MSDNDAFIEDYGDSLNDAGDPYETKTTRNAAEALDASLQAPNANDFSNARLIEEVRTNDLSYRSSDNAVQVPRPWFAATVAELELLHTVYK